MNRQWPKGVAATIKEEILSRQSSPWWENWFNWGFATGAGIGSCLYNMTTSSGTAVASGTATKVGYGYPLALAVAAGVDQVNVTLAPPNVWDVVPGDPIAIGGGGGSGVLSPFEIRRADAVLNTGTNAYRVYLDRPLDSAHGTSEAVIRLYAKFTLSSALATAQTDTKIRWAYTLGSSLMGIHEELVDFVTTPLRNPALPSEFLDRWPGYVRPNVPLEIQYRGIQKTLDQAWTILAERIRLAGYAANKVLSLDQFRQAIYWIAAENLCQNGHFPFPPIDPEATLQRMRQQVEAEVTRTLSDIIWYDADDDGIKGADEEYRDIGTIRITV